MFLLGACSCMQREKILLNESLKSVKIIYFFLLAFKDQRPFFYDFI